MTVLTTKCRVESTEEQEVLSMTVAHLLSTEFSPPLSSWVTLVEQN